MRQMAFFARSWRDWRPEARVELLAFLASAAFVLTANRLFWEAMLDGRPLASSATWGYALALGALLTGIHFLLLCLLLNRWTAKPLLALLIVATAGATHFMGQFGVYLDPDMLRNVLHTDFREARELFSWSLLRHLLLYAAIPLWLLSRVRVKRIPLPRALGFRLLALTVALAVSGGALLLVFQDFSSAMRNHKERRYLITPGNIVYSLLRTVSTEAKAADKERLPLGTDAVLNGRAAKPLLLVLVVGETARAANWGLNGYARQTTPQLAKRDVLNFSDVTSCGTNTEVSVPCLFSPLGRRHYDEERIRSSESLLHVLHRAGFRVVWHDNQAGCKGVCDGLEQARPAAGEHPGLCNGDGCFDEALLNGLERTVADTAGNLVVALHQIGNHGPAYFKRYPEAFRRYTPACESADLAKCSREEIVNAYDNALLYTDYLLARSVDFLKTQNSHDTALIYLSDHGESLGENGLFLHGMPHAIAPDVQTRVPMVMWFSPSYARNAALDLDCLRRRAARPAAHDHLFHTVLGMLGVRTRIYEAEMDLTAECRT